MLTQIEAKTLFNSDDSGNLVWIVKTNRRITVGSIAGVRRPDGYVNIGINGKRYLAHRIMWLLIRGEPIPHEIDHIDGNPTNNRIENLRDGSGWRNRANAGARKGLKGAHFDKRKGKWFAVIRHKFLGYFPTEKEAYSVAQAAAVELFGEYAHA